MSGQESVCIDLMAQKIQNDPFLPLSYSESSESYSSLFVSTVQWTSSKYQEKVDSL